MTAHFRRMSNGFFYERVIEETPILRWVQGAPFWEHSFYGSLSLRALLTEYTL